MGRLAIKDTHYIRLKSKVFTALAKAPRGTAGQALRSMRVRWDIFWAATKGDNFAFINELYRYLNDNHIDSALKSIIREYNVRIDI